MGAVEFIRCIDGWDPQIHEVWCLGSGSVTCEIHLTEKVEVGDGTVRQFTTNYLAENGRIIPIIGQLSINRSVELLGIPKFSRKSGLLFIENLKSLTVTTVWGHDDTFNHNWGVSPGGPYRNVKVS